MKKPKPIDGWGLVANEGRWEYLVYLVFPTKREAVEAATQWDTVVRVRISVIEKRKRK
jgi:hypothetical protein